MGLAREPQMLPRAKEVSVVRRSLLSIQDVLHPSRCSGHAPRVRAAHELCCCTAAQGEFCLFGWMGGGGRGRGGSVIPFPSQLAGLDIVEANTGRVGSV